MPFFQSPYLAMVAGGTAKRLAFLAAEAVGIDRRNADLLSDEIAIVAAHTIGTAASLVTCDLSGFGLTIAHTTLMENDLARKREG